MLQILQETKESQSVMKGLMKELNEVVLKEELSYQQVRLSSGASTTIT